MSESRESRMILTKLEVARRQLEVGIHMYFNGGDPVSTHTLATAALQVLSDLNNPRKGSPMLSDIEVSGGIRPDKLELARRIIREAQNFFKHADKDPTGLLNFNPEFTVFYLFEAVEKYRELSEENRPIMRVLALWFRVQWTEAFILPDHMATLFAFLRSAFRLDDKSKFYAEFVARYVAEASKAGAACTDNVISTVLKGRFWPKSK